MNDNKPTGELSFAVELYAKIMNAGFLSCPHDYREIINRLNGTFPNPENNLRMFYLMYCGLAKAEIKIPKGEFDMAGEYISIDSLFQFRDYIYGPYKVIKGGFDHHINLRKLKLHRCTDYLLNGPEGFMEDVIPRLRNKIFQRLGCVWHAQWLYKHQEFIPKTWFDIWKSGGSIVFPGTQLVGDRSDNVNIRYAILKNCWITGKLDLCFKDEGNLHRDKTNYFIATVGPNTEETLIRQGRVIKTRRYRNP